MESESLTFIIAWGLLAWGAGMVVCMFVISYDEYETMNHGGLVFATWPFWLPVYILIRAPRLIARFLTRSLPCGITEYMRDVRGLLSPPKR